MCCYVLYPGQASPWGGAESVSGNECLKEALIDTGHSLTLILDGEISRNQRKLNSQGT